MTPILHLGLDLAYRRDMAAAVGVYRDYETGVYCLHCHKVWEPPVHIPAVTDYVLERFADESVAGIWFDPHQYAAEAQRLNAQGYGRFLHEVNQSGPFMIQIATTLHTHLQAKTLDMYDDNRVASFFSWCAVKMTEAGPRIIKQAQTKPIDFVVACAMALHGASQDEGYLEAPSFDEKEHVVQLEMLI